MTAIAPNTTVYLVNTRLNYGSEDTFYFDSLSAQTDYFEARRLWGMTNYTYQREQRQYIKVGVNGSQMATVIKSANYLMWKNTSYEDKYYYAFITEAEWINNEVVKLYFEMDYIQTYLFNYGHTQCYIVRQHSETDNIGDNILPEPIELGEYVTNGNHRCRPTEYEYRDGSCTVVAEIQSDQSQARLIDGVFTGVKYTVYPNTPNGINAIQTKINSERVSQDPRWILAIYASKWIFVGLDPEYVTPRELATSGEPLEYDIEIPTINDTDRLNGYLPRNKKLYTYPYTFLNVSNCKGSDINVRYEFWNKIEGTSNHILKMLCTRGLPVTVQIRPYSYKNETSSGGTRGLSSDTFVELNSFPQGSWSIDSYSIWNAQNQGNLLGSGINIVGNGLIGAAAAGLGGNPGAPLSILSDTLSYVTQWAVQAYNASIAADRFSGTLAGSSVQFNTSVDLPIYRRMSINAQYAKVIDDFFTMYGYAQNKVGFPNIHARSRYTYIRTIGFNCTANIPQEARSYINARYDAGIRFWVDHENTFCNYTNANTPLSSTTQTVEERTDNDSET